MATSKFRVGGGYTTINWGTTPLMYVDLIRETAPRPVAAPQPIQPMDSKYPIEVAFPNALEAGTLEISFREQWGAEVWTQIPIADFQSAADLLDIFTAQLQKGTTLGQDFSITKVITAPGGTQRSITYMGCVVINVMVDETVNIGTMTFPKSIQIMYLRRFETQSVNNNGGSLTYPTAVVSGTETLAGADGLYTPGSTTYYTQVSGQPA